MIHPATEATPNPPEQINAELVAVMRRYMDELTFRAGAQLFAQDVPADDLYVVCTGRAKLVRVTSDGNDLILCMPGPGEPFCPVTMLDGGPQLGTAFAVSDVTLLHCNRKKFELLCREHPEVLIAIQAACLGEVRRLAQRLELRSFGNLRKRLAGVLLDASRIASLHGGEAGLLDITQQNLADIIGASRERVTTVLTEWREAGIIKTHRGGVRIMRRDDLIKLL
jgi:CRP/FNR family transcriptional regulator, cyclic AMP receptor protein